MGRAVGALEAETQAHVKYIDEIIKVQCKELNLRKGVLQQTQRTLNLNVYRTHFRGKICRKPTRHTPHPVQNHWVTVELNNLPDFGRLVLLKYKKNLPEAPPEPPKQPAHRQNFMPER